MRAAAEQRQLDERAGRVLLRVWNPNADPVADAVGEMQQLAGSMRQAVDVLGARLDPGEACEHCGRSSESLDSVSGAAWLRVLRELRQLLEGMERLGIEDRQVRIDEGVAQVILAAHMASFAVAPADLDVVVREAMTEAFRAALRQGGELEAGQVTA